MGEEMGIHESARKIAFKHKPKLCEKCNRIKKRIEVHHINGNHNDNRIENLMVLCSSCHHIIDKRINNIFNEPKWKNNMARTLQIKNELKIWRKRDEFGRFLTKKPYKEPSRFTGKKHTAESKQKNSMTFQLKRNEKLLVFLFNQNEGGKMGIDAPFGERRLV